MTELREHVAVHGPLPEISRRAAAQLIDEIDAAGLRGHGGAWFPTAVKLRAVAGRRGPKVVVANGVEAEPPSKNDRALMREAPHLVLDGAEVAARAVGAADVLVAVAESDERSLRSLGDAIDQRAAAQNRDAPRVELVTARDRYLAGHEAALISALNGGEARPTFGPRPFEQGVRRRSTLVQNVETLAHIALIARHGARWFRELGTHTDPGSTLVTIGGAVRSPGVYEVDRAMTLDALLETAAAERDLQGVLVGGYFGTWLTANEATNTRLCTEELSRFGAGLGAGVIVALGAGSCAVAETARVADYFAAESAGQCGPCVNGLPAIADTIHQLATGTAHRDAYDDLARWAHVIPGRGACAHPDGAVRFVRSALGAFAEQFDRHARAGRCERCSSPAVLPTPALTR
jgi:NADH:ubiquinone oxidoreductase subunit F (NADH-binding)